MRLPGACTYTNLELHDKQNHQMRPTAFICPDVDSISEMPIDLGGSQEGAA